MRQHVPEIVELVVIERIENGNPFVGAPVQERDERVPQDVVRAIPLLALTRDSHDVEGIVRPEAPPYGLDDSGFPHTRFAFDHDELGFPELNEPRASETADSSRLRPAISASFKR